MYATVDATTEGAAHGGPQEAYNELHASNTMPQVACKVSQDWNPGQGRGADELDPAGHKEPSMHGAVQFGRDRPVVFPNVPGGHKTGDDDPAGQNDPIGHVMFVDDPNGQNDPIGHVLHAERPFKGAKDLQTNIH